MSSYYPTKFQNISWGTGNNSTLIKIADMEKQSGSISPLVMFAYEKHAQQTSTFFFLSIVNRSEGVFASVKNLGPDSIRNSSFYYKESGSTLSLYVLLSPYGTVVNIFANPEGTSAGILKSEIQSSTDVSGMTKIQAQ